MRTIQTILIVITLGVLASCDDAFLDRYPSDELSDANFWKKQQDAELFVNNLYNALPDFSIDDDIMSDNAVHGIKWAEGDVAKGIYDPLDGRFSGKWSTNYETIRRANVLLENIDNIETIDADVKKQLIAQAKFFRAYAHADLAMAFGDIPMVNKTLSIEETYSLKRHPVETVVDFICLDLKELADNLPKSWSADYGRITKGAALAFKARVELFFHRYSEAEQSAKDVIDLGVYELYKGNYAELFYSSLPGDQRKKEMVIETQRKADDKGNWFNTWSAPPGFGWGGINPTQSFVDEFECTNGLTISDPSNLVYDDANPFENRDPRLEANVLHHGETFKGMVWGTRPVTEDAPQGIATHGDATATGYYQQKFFDPEDDTNGTNAWQSGHDWPVLRYAEVLLTYAEARMEQNKIDDATYSVIDEIRERVNMPSVDREAYNNQTTLRELIRREWRVEFGMEGRRWLDIRRWNIGMEVLNGQFLGMKYDASTQTAFIGENVKAGVVRKYAAHNRLWPIPQTQRDLNSNLTQNDGYPQ